MNSKENDLPQINNINHGNIGDVNFEEIKLDNRKSETKASIQSKTPTNPSSVNENGNNCDVSQENNKSVSSYIQDVDEIEKELYLTHHDTQGLKLKKMKRRKQDSLHNDSFENNDYERNCYQDVNNDSKLYNNAKEFDSIDYDIPNSQKKKMKRNKEKKRKQKLSQSDSLLGYDFKKSVTSMDGKKNGLNDIIARDVCYTTNNLSEVDVNDPVDKVDVEDKSYVNEKNDDNNVSDNNNSDQSDNAEQLNSIDHYSLISQNKEVKQNKEKKELKNRKNDILDEIFGIIKSSPMNSNKNNLNEDNGFDSHDLEKTVKKNIKAKDMSKRVMELQKHPLDIINEDSSIISSSDNDSQLMGTSELNIEEIVKKKIKDESKKKREQKHALEPIYKDSPVTPEISSAVSDKKKIQADIDPQNGITLENDCDKTYIKQKKTKNNNKNHTETFLKNDVKINNAYHNQSDKMSSEIGLEMSYSNDKKYDDKVSKIEENFYEGKLRQTDFDDSCKVFLSRIPRTFDTQAVQRAMETAFGVGCVHHVVIQKSNKNETPHSGRRNFGFVVLSTEELCQKALDVGAVKGKFSEDSKRNYIMYIKPIVRNEYQEQENIKKVCYLWKEKTCSYGEECQFLHEGEGGYTVKTDKYTSESKKKVKKKKFKKKCKGVCIQWRSKGKCRKLKYNKCPYTHDESILEEFRTKQEKKRKVEKDAQDAIRKNEKKKRKKEKHEPLFITVLGIKKTIKTKSVESFFQTCGTIMNISYKYGIGSSSDGYWTIVFQSPKAVTKACQLDGQEWKGNIIKVFGGKLKWNKKNKINEKKIE